MSKSLPQGVDAELYRETGIIRVAHPCENPFAPYTRPKDVPDYLALVQHGKRKLKKKEYKERLKQEQRRRDLLLRELTALKLSMITALEGRDASGKTGTTKALVGEVDFDTFDVIHIDKPSEEEARAPFLRRFLDRGRLPAFGQVRIFDRTWYGEVLVVPVDKLASKEHVQQAYGMCNAMELLLVQSGVVLCKIWCDVSKDEQKRRFRDRIAEDNGKFKESDVKARKQWSQYSRYINKMFHLTGTDAAPWYVLPSDDKPYLRVMALWLTNNALEAAIKAAKAKSVN